MEVLAAHIDETLTADESLQVVDHLADCESCFQIVAETVAFQEQEERDRRRAAGAAVPAIARPGRWRRPSPRLAAGLAAAAVVALVLLLPASRALLARHRPFGSDPTRELIAAAPDARFLEPRLASFPYRPLYEPTRGGPAGADPDLDALQGVSGRLHKQLQHERSVANLHAYGVAQLLLRRAPEAVDTLEDALRLESGETVPSRAIERSRDAQLLSDLSAAYYARGAQQRKPQDLLSAIAAADAAIRNDDTLLEAKFNRALAVETTHLRTDAARAWVDYLHADDESQWAQEARRHLKVLSTPSSALKWGGFSASFDRAAAAGNLAAVTSGVIRFPREARLHAEEELLAAWGEAWPARKEEAARTLTMARTIGAALAGTSGESMMADSVAVIDAAADKSALAAAHASYGTVRALLKHQQYAQAGPMMDGLAADLSRAGSPFAMVAALKGVICSYYANRSQDTLARIEAIDHAKLIARYPATGGLTDWMAGLAHLSLGHPNEALGAYQNALVEFRRTNERDHIAAMQTRIAETLEQLNDVDGAWTHRYEALALFEEQGSPADLQDTLVEAANAALRQEQLHAAMLFADRVVTVAHVQGKPSYIADAHLVRSRVRRHLGDTRGADDDLGAARQQVSQIPDAAQRQRAEARVDWQQAADGGAALSSIPGLERSVEFYRHNGNRIMLLFALLHRGNAFMAGGNRSAARDDFAAGVDELEALTDDLRDEELRASYFDGASQVYDSMLGVLASDRSNDALFEYMERSRARLMLDPGDEPERRRAALPRAAEIQRRLPEKTTLVELSLLRDGRLLEMVIRRGGVSLIDTPLNPFALQADAERLASVISDGEESQRILRGLSQVLIDPIRSRLVKDETVVFVPDASLASVPFPALVDTSTGRYLIQDFDVAVSPSAALYVAGVERDRELSVMKESTSLVASNPTFDPLLFPKLEPLPGATVESDFVARLNHATVLDGANATKTQLLEGMSRASMIHFSGHSVINERHPLMSGLVVAPDASNGSSILYAHDILACRFPSTRLVVLSACSTAGGGRGGAGVSTIARAFLATGVPAVVGSLWDVSDAASAELLTQFHRNLKEGDTAAHALRRSQIALLSGADSRFRSPAAWGAFQILGGTSL